MGTLAAIALELEVLGHRPVISLCEMPIELYPGKSDRDILVEIVTTLNRLTSDLADARESLEPRIRALEGFRWWILGACAGLSFMGGMIGHVLWH
jgi:hypothetical protein